MSNTANTSIRTTKRRIHISRPDCEKDRWRLVATGAQVENDFEMEQVMRLTAFTTSGVQWNDVLEALYTKRRLEPANPGIFYREFETLIGRPQEHLEFTMWYPRQKKLVGMDDKSCLVLTVDGLEYLERSYRSTQQQRRLQA